MAGNKMEMDPDMLRSTAKRWKLPRLMCEKN